MLRHSKLALLLWVAAILLLPLRAANAHVHLCLDGQAPAMTMHVQDLPTHDGTSEEVGGHTDRDVQLTGSLSVGKAPGVEKMSLLDAYVLARLLPTQQHNAPQAFVVVPDVPLPFGLYPPPRGPPV
ncbi:MAG TPA: hypothetical protein VJS42_05340 [Steroidobacteraceae bacterium]|nr:hypothetical protein [Steroidobacteraceae bacterium]